MMVVLYGQIDYRVEPYAHWDLAAYRQIASASPGIATAICQPFAFRLFGPYLVGLLPLPDPLGFYVLAVFSSTGLVILFYQFLCYSGLCSSVATLSVTLFIFNKQWFGFTIWNYFQINDVLSLILIIILFWSMMRDHWALFAITLLLGSLTRETSLLMVPVALVYLLEKKRFATSWKKAVAACIPGLLAFLLLRILIPTECGQDFLVALRTYSQKLLSIEDLLRLLVNSSLPFTFIPVVFHETTLQFFRDRRYAILFVVLVFLSALFGSNDERLMAPAFIVFYALVGAAVQELDSRRQLGTVLISCGFLSSLHHACARYPLPNIAWTYLFSVGALLIATGVAIVYRTRYFRQSGVAIQVPADRASPPER